MFGTRTTCRHCGEVIHRMTGHYRLSQGDKATHDATIERDNRMLDRIRFREWLAADYPARGLRILAKRVQAEGRVLRIHMEGC